MTTQADRTNQDAFNAANPQGLASLFQMIGLGDLLRGQLLQFRRAVNQVVNGLYAGNLATLQVLQLPDKGKASVILRATVRAGGVTGELTPVAYGVTPATTQIAVGPNGNIVTLAADVITDVDIEYLPERGDVIESFFPVVADAIVLPASITAEHVVLLEEVEALSGTATGVKVVLIPGAGAPAAGQARLNLAKSTITFAAADAVTRARVKLLVGTSKDLNAVLDAAATVV